MTGESFILYSHTYIYAPKSVLIGKSGNYKSNKMQYKYGLYQNITLKYKRKIAERKKCDVKRHFR